MQFRIHHRLFAGFVGIVALMGVLALALVGSGLRQELKNTYREELRRQLQLAEWIVSSPHGLEPDPLARAITERVGYRTSLISVDGVVLGDSYVEPSRLPQVENHSDRPEVQGALRGELTFAERTSATVSDPLLYGAQLVLLRGEPVILRLAAPLTEVERTVDRVQRAVAFSGLLAMVLALVIAYLASRALSRPLVHLAQMARRFGAGDFTERAPRQVGVPELDDLGQAFNRLTEELKIRLDELRRERDEMQALIDCMAEGVVALTDDARVLRANRAARGLLGFPEAPPFAPVATLVRHPELRDVLDESVVRPVHAREIAIGDRHVLVSSRLLDTGGAVATFLDVSEIRRLEQVRRDFVANASHELKTPLTTMLGFAETLLEDETSEELRTKFLTAIRDNTVRLQRLVEDLLDLSRLEAGGWVVEVETMTVRESAAQEWAALAEAAAEKGIEFGVEADHEVRADRQALGQVLRNLLENALRHTDEGGHIHVRSEVGEASMVVVEVSDDGQGIPSKSLPRIFERFYRADSSRARDVGGTGLGLAIVRHLLGAMGGTVEAESELGRGTTIRFTLPPA